MTVKNRRSGAQLRERLTALGVLRGTGHEHLRGSLVVPVLDTAGTVTQLYGRKLRDDLKAGTPTHVWLPGDIPAVFNAAGVTGVDELIVTGSIRDALTWWCAGFRNVVADLAVATAGPVVGETVAELVRREHIGRVLIAYPRPVADDAASRLATELSADGVECFRVLLPRGGDAHDVAVDAAKPAEALAELVRGARWAGVGPAPAVGVDPAAPPGPPRRTRPTLAAVTAPRPAEPPPAAAVEEEPAPVASPMPAPPAEPVTEIADEELRVSVGDRRWRVRGLAKVTSVEALRVNLLAARTDPVLGELFHLDTLDLYSARSRAAFTAAAAGELRVGEAVLRRDLGRVLLACEAHAAELIRAAAHPKPVRVEMSEQDRAAALDLLRDPKLIGRVVADFARAGMVGETTNALVGYLAATSRKLARPLGLVIQSPSAAGKSSLADAVLAFVPPEDRVALSAVTGQALFYLGETDLAHKLLAVAETDGAARAGYALKLLASDGELSIASTGKEPGTGRLVTHTYRVSGPTAIVLTTTAIDVEEELANRALVLAVDEDREQTRAIHAAQRHAQTLDGLRGQVEADAIRTLHQNAQRLLDPIAVVNRYAPQLSFPDLRTRTRRDHAKYLTLIAAVALLHQHQRPRRTLSYADRQVDYIEVERADITIANTLAHEVFGRSLDELAPQTRRLLDLIDGHVAATATGSGVLASDVRFTRRDIRAATGWSDFQVRTHLARLVELDYVTAHRGGRGASYLYELTHDGGGTTGTPHLPGLTDPATLVEPHGYDRNFEGAEGEFEGGSSPYRAPVEHAVEHPDDGEPVALHLAAGGGR